jgi:hypothetical protein
MFNIINYYSGELRPHDLKLLVALCITDY